MGIVIDMAAARRARARRAQPALTAGAMAAPALMAGVALFTLYIASTFAVAAIGAAHLNTWRS